MSEGSDKVFHVYRTNPALQCFDRVKIVQIKFFQDIQDESEHFRENISQKRTSSELAIDGIRYKRQSHGSQLEIQLKETFKKFTQQLNHEIDLCKKDLQQHLEEKGKVDLIFKSLLSLSVKDERIVV